MIKIESFILVIWAVLILRGLRCLLNYLVVQSTCRAENYFVVRKVIRLNVEFFCTTNTFDFHFSLPYLYNDARFFWSLIFATKVEVLELYCFVFSFCHIMYSTNRTGHQLEFTNAIKLKPFLASWTCKNYGRLYFFHHILSHKTTSWLGGN